MAKETILKGTECADARCAEFVPGEGYFCRRFKTWAGVCPNDHKESRENEQTTNLYTAPGVPVQEG